ncbi:MAG TPA: hypothetical protein VKF42_04690 [Chitinivibrionales bacterium]|jgi:hypothetical protein|nr:hypothetical protein [Chitinivibrionales bacterium]
MNSKKNRHSSPRKAEKGRPVFGDNVDHVLTKRIIGHSTEPGAGEASPVFASAAPRDKTTTPDSSFTYRTPEEKREQKRSGYGLAALVCLGLLAVITFLWTKFRDD